MKPQKSTKGTKSTNRIIVGLVVMCVWLGVSCRRSGNEKRFDLKGKVMAVEREKHLVTVSHEDIKDYMPAMTMPFTVHSDADLQIIAPDDEITATLVVDGSHSWLENLIIPKQNRRELALPR